MSDELMLELEVATVDEAAVQAVEEHLQPLHPERWKGSRDVITLITVASSAVGLVNALLTLKDRLAADPHLPRIKVKNALRQEVELSTATPEEIETLVAAGQE